MRSTSDFRYLPGVSSLRLDVSRCQACGACLEVCPRAVLTWDPEPGPQDGQTKAPPRRVHLADRDACIECGACARNCPFRALTLKPGAGCATLIMQQWLARYGIRWKPPSSGCC